MPANVSQLGGVSEAIIALEPAWWDSEGKYVADHYLTSEEVWGDHGVLDFELELRPVYGELGEKGGEIPGWKRTVRKDTGVTVGLGMKGNYKLVQPRQAFNWMDSLMNDGVMKYAAAGVLNQGAQIWVLGCIPHEKKDDTVDNFRKYILWLDDFTGGKSLLWFPCFTRVVCENTANIAKGERDCDTFRAIRHSGDIEAKLKAARRAIIDAETAFKQYNADCAKLLDHHYSKAEACEFVDTLIPVPVDDKTGKPVEGRSATIRERKVEAIRDGLRHETNQVDGMCGTFYQLYNAVTFAVDHRNVFSFRGEAGSEKRRKNRWLSLMTGQGADLKSQAFNLALQMCG